MDAKKEPKNVEFLDINQTMNNLLTKIAETITGPNEDVIKGLTDISSILSSLGQVDKTSTYILTEETIGKVDKALERVELPSDKQLKSIGIELPSYEKTFKLDESEIPQNEEEARQKFNQIVDDNIDKTIKTINDVIEISQAEDKGEINVPDVTEERAGKVLSDILLTLLAKSLKEISNVEFPEERNNKNSEEIDIDAISRTNKESGPLDRATGVSEKRRRDLEFADQADTKEDQVIDQSIDKSEKEVFSVGQFPSLSDKSLLEVSTVLGNAKPLPNDSDTLEVSTSSIESNKGSTLIAPSINKPSKIEEDFDANLSKESKEDTISPDAITPQTLNALREIGRLDLPGEKNKIGSGLSIPKKGEEKEGSPNRWYGNWGFLFGKGNNPRNSIGNAQLSLGGISAGETNAFTRSAFGVTAIGGGLQRAIGGTLTFFGMTPGDIGLFLNRRRRWLNTIANGFILTREINDAYGTGQFFKENERRLNENIIYRLIVAALRNKEVKNELTPADLPAEQQKMLSQPIKERGKSTGAPTFAGDDFDNDDTRFQDLIATTVDRDKTVVSGSGAEVTTFGDEYRERTVKIRESSAAKGTGWLRIYTKRGPKFRFSQNEIKIIPFQFEPTVSGDSKAAEYATIQTLARSQSAQVYRRSSERNINIELDYVVVNEPSTDLDRNFVNSSKNDAGPSLSVKDMTHWTEDYIYNYVVRNMRNLVLPNIVGPRYKLAPAIIQVWYGGLGSLTASSTGDAIPDDTNEAMLSVFPTFRTNWYDDSGNQRQYRSLWVCKNVGFEFKGGKVNSNSRNNVWVTVQLSLTEIAPSITDNEVMLWAKIS